MSSARRGSLGAERERHETTAAHAQAEAPTAAIAHEVEENVEQAKEAAEEVAEIARAMGTEMTGEPESTFDVLQREAAEKTKEAVAEGQKDVHSAKETGASYLDQAKSMAESVLASAQEFLRGSTEDREKASAGQQTETATQPQDMPGSLKTAAGAAVGTAQEYLASAQAAVQPQVEGTRATLEPHVASAKATVQPHIEKAKETAQSYLGMGTQPEGEGVTPPASMTTASEEKSSTAGQAEPKVKSDVA